MNVPTLRFPGFEGEWEERPLENLFIEFKSGLGITSSSIEDSGLYPVFGGNGLRGYTSSFTHEGFYFLIGRQGALCGNVNRFKGKAYVSEHAIACRANDTNDTEWLAQRLEFENLNKLSESSAQPGLSVAKLLKYKLFLPTLPEQQKIASFLSKVDEKLTQLKKKKELLEQYKKGMIQKIFSQEIRFKDDNGEEFPDWEEKEILNFAPLQRGFDLPIDNIEHGQVPVIFSNGILKFHNEYKVKGPGIVTGRSGTIGRVTYTEEDYWPHNTALWVTDFKGNHPKFIYFFYVNMNLHKLSTGSGVPTLNRNDVHAQRRFVPSSLPEQTKIANFLSSLDQKIAHTQTQIEKAELWKKGLLQQLFV